MQIGRRQVRRVADPAVVLAAALTCFGVLVPALAATPVPSSPNLIKGSAYLVSQANLIGGDYYDSLPHVADFGLTIDGALALAATGDEDRALSKIVAFIDGDGKDASGKTVNDWTGIGTAYVSGGAIGKEALLAEVVGDNPRDFGGHDLIAALNASVCRRPSAGGRGGCPGTGSYLNATSVFDQALGIIAQLRAGDRREAAAPIAFLEGLQNADGSFASLIPKSGGPDVDSTAIAVMALALVPGTAAAAAVSSGLAWIAGQEDGSGGFPGAGGDSVNSAGLAIQALTLRDAQYLPKIDEARAFLERQQNGNGGFNANASGQRGSDLRASAQAVSGAVGVSFGTLRRSLSHRQAAARDGNGGTAARWGIPLAVVVLAAVVIAVLLVRRRRIGAATAASAPAQAPPVMRS
jgi:hypothetical protein